MILQHMPGLYGKYQIVSPKKLLKQSEDGHTISGAYRKE